MSYTRSATSTAARRLPSLSSPKANRFGPTTSSDVVIIGCSDPATVGGSSPTFVKFSALPALMRTRPGTKLYSTLLPPILIVSTPVTIGPTGPATVGGGGGGYSGPSCPFNEKAQTASPLALPCS